MTNSQKTTLWTSLLILCLSISAWKLTNIAGTFSQEPVSVQNSGITALPVREIVSDNTLIPIEQIKVGQRVNAHNPEVSQQERGGWKEPIWESWIKLSLTMPKPNGGEVKIQIIRPESWVQSQIRYNLAKKLGSKKNSSSTEGGTPDSTNKNVRAVGDEEFTNQSKVTRNKVPFSPLRPIYKDLLLKSLYINSKAEENNFELVGLSIDLDLPELNLSGFASVDAIEPAPPVQSGEGRVVTATFHHSSSEVIDLVIGDTDRTSITETIGTTATHPFWSEDRQEYISAGKLRLGETLLTNEGDKKQVISQLPRPGPTPVFNLEVHGEHVYYVGENELLVHNECGHATIWKTSNGKHVGISVHTTSGEQLVTHLQWIEKGNQTVIVEAIDLFNDVFNKKGSDNLILYVDLDDASSAMDLQLQLMNGKPGKFNPANNCATHVADILKAGGFDTKNLRELLAIDPIELGNRSTIVDNLFDFLKAQDD